MSDVGLMGMHVPGMSWRDIREAAVLAEELGYSCITMGESWGEDALTSLAQIAAVTSRIRVGTSILPVFARSPANIGEVLLSILERRDWMLPAALIERFRTASYWLSARNSNVVAGFSPRSGRLGGARPADRSQ